MGLLLLSTGNANHTLYATQVCVSVLVFLLALCESPIIFSFQADVAFVGRSFLLLPHCFLLDVVFLRRARKASEHKYELGLVCKKQNAVGMNYD